MSEENKNSYTFWEEQASNQQNQPQASDSQSFTQAQQTQEQEVTAPSSRNTNETYLHETNSYQQNRSEDPFSNPAKDAWDNPAGYQRIYTGYTNGAIPADPPKKKKKASKKILGFIAKAAVFGFVAGGVFLGFNKVYYHFNPDALPSLQQNAGNSGNGSLQIPNQHNTLSTTKIMQDVDTTYTDVSAVVEKTLPATVAITSKFVTNNYFYGQYTQEGGGSGIIIGENDTEYLIATNDHVVDGASSISVSFIDAASAEAYIKGTDPSADLAVIAVKKDSLSKETKDSIIIATLGNSDDVKVGNMVIAIGNALGNGQSTTVGWISAKDREVTNSDTGTTLTVLQTDAAINPGNSGGALLNIKGEVIGINSAKISGTKVEGIGYAIPISKALPIVSDLMTREVLTDDEKGYLGITLTDMDITADIASAYNWPMGVYVKEVLKDSAAQKGGLIAGDIITAVNGSSITTRAQLQKTINSYRYGTTVTITYSRFENGSYEEHTTDVVLSQASILDNATNNTTPKKDSNSTKPNKDSKDNDSNESELPPKEDQQTPDNGSLPEGNGGNSLEDFFDRFFGNFGF